MGLLSGPGVLAYKSILIFLAPGVGRALQRALSVLLPDRTRVISLPEEAKPEMLIKAACRSDSPSLLITETEILDKIPGELKRRILGGLEGPALALRLLALDHLEGEATEAPRSYFISYDLVRILKIVVGESPAIAGVISVFKPRQRALIRLLTHDFLPMIKVNKEYFEELYTLSVDWLPRIFGRGEGWPSEVNESLKGEIKKAFVAKDEGRLAKIIRSMNSSLTDETDSFPRAGLSGPVSYSEMFIENADGLIRTIRASLPDLPEASLVQTRDFLAAAALNFWLCWWTWMSLGFDNNHEALFNNTFYQETFYYIALNAGRAAGYLKAVYKKGSLGEVVCELENKMREVEELMKRAEGHVAAEPVGDLSG